MQGKWVSLLSAGLVCSLVLQTMNFNEVQFFFFKTLDEGWLQNKQYKSGNKGKRKKVIMYLSTKPH